MKRLALYAVSLWLVTAAASGQVTYRYSDFAEGPAKFLMTKEEARQWKIVTTDAEAQAFVDLFWARRDPTPNTARNEYREEFDKRVAFADQRWGNGRLRGALSDPGRVFILLGEPYRITGHSGAASTSTAFGAPAQEDASGSIVVPKPTSDSDKQYWMYAHEKKPKFIGLADFTMTFADEGRGDWKLATTERTNPDRILMQAANAAIVSPNLTKVPVYKSAHATSFANAELKAAYEQFRSGSEQRVGPASLTWGEFVAAEGNHFVSTQLYVPAGSSIAPGQKVTFFSVVENKAGEIVDVKEEEATLTAAGSDAYVDRSIELDPGTYTATFGLASGGKVLTASRTPITVEGFDPKAPAVSPLLLATSVYPLKSNWEPTDPFTFGGFKVIPKGDLAFVPKGDLWYFVEVRNPGTDKGLPNVKMQIDIAGRTANGPVALNLPLTDAKLVKLKGETDRYGIGLSIPLEGFVPGDYTMKLHLEDAVLGKKYDLQKAFKVHS